MLKSRKLLLAYVNQWNAVALWAWDIVVDNCAICRNHIMDLCTFPQSSCPTAMLTPSKASNVKPTKRRQRAKSAQSLGGSAMLVLPAFNDRARTNNI